MDSKSNFAALTRGGGQAVPRPRSRWLTRVALPLALLLGAGGMLAYTGRSAMWPAVDVRAVSVVTKAAGSTDQPSTERRLTVQSPGWIEPDPFPVLVSALADGVIREVLVLEGSRVEAGQVVARMIDEDAKLAERVARAEAEAKSAEVARAMSEADRARADVGVEMAMAAELRDDVGRKRVLLTSRAVAEGEVRQLELRLEGQMAKIAAAEAAVKEAESAVTLARADLRRAEAALETASLTLSRMEVRAATAGVVLSLLASPGSRMMTEGQNPLDAVVLRLYDPGHLQVRADIPLADAAKVGVDQEAEITTEALPDRVFAGRVSRLVHEANIQKNTVQVKVAIKDAQPPLKPEMLTKVRFYSAAGAAGGGVAAAGSTRVFVPEAALQEASGDRAVVWVLEEARSTATRHEVSLSGASTDGWREVREGVLPGDRVIVDPPRDLNERTKLRVKEDTDVHAAH